MAFHCLCVPTPVVGEMKVLFAINEDQFTEYQRDALVDILAATMRLYADSSSFQPLLFDAEEVTDVLRVFDESESEVDEDLEI